MAFLSRLRLTMKHLWRRMTCHVLLASLPDRGLEEAAESLSRMRDFHGKPAPNLAVPPPLPALVVELSPPYVRPEFYATED